MEQGFIDLRGSAHGNSESASFWPSFTDIMTVVVMIFMLASVVVILRNWELVQELRNTMEAERRAAELARTTSETNATLEEQLAQAQHLITEMRMQLMQAEESDKLKTQMLDEREKSIAELQNRLAATEANLQSSERQARLLDEQLKQSHATNALQESQLENLNLELTGMEQDFQRQQEELAKWRQREQQTQQQFASLQGEYDSLKVKYDKLIKPARTAKGKHVVEVRYEKSATDYQIRFKESADAGYQTLSRPALEQQLDKLKAEYPKQLYVKIIIPADSGLSYSEAWSFMKGLLEKYDYYYQE